jgi:predicted Rossmann-fold nucleotide-binding protein
MEMRTLVCKLLLFIGAGLMLQAHAVSTNCAAGLIAPTFRVEQALPESYRNLRSTYSSLGAERKIRTKEAADTNSALQSVKDELHYRSQGIFSKLFGGGMFSARPLKGYSKNDLNRSRSQLESDLQIHQRAVEDIDRRLAAFEKQMRDSHPELLRLVHSELTKFMQNNPDYAATINDVLTYGSVRQLDPKRTISLLMGSPWSEPAEREKEAALAIAAHLTQKGFTLLLDAHSRLTPLLMRKFPERTLAIGASREQELESGRQLVIQDPYLRWLALTRGGDIIGSPSNAVALSAVLFNSIDYVVAAGPDYNPEALKKWRSRLRDKDIDLGVPDYKETAPKSVEKVLNAYKQSVAKQDFRLLQTGELSLQQIDDLTEQARLVAANKPVTAQAKAVVFGSGRIDPDSAPLVYEVSYDLSRSGIGVATGGAGGAMLASNMGAFDGGGASVGIPITGRNALATEKDSPAQFHTQTIEADSYESRVPLLMHGKSLFVVAPGGAGTIRELVTTIVHLNQPEPPRGLVVFLRASYYQRPLEFLTQAGLDPKLAARLAVADTREDFVRVIRAAAESGLIELGEPVPNKPRTERRSLPLE